MATPPQRKFTVKELLQYNGIARDEIYVAYKNKVYDVSQSRFWKTGLHYEHWAGQDLTQELKEAPHSETLLLKFPVVGVLIKEKKD